MGLQRSIRQVFGHFQNLNLLALLEDLRCGRTARGAWASGSSLCPVAHGLLGGRTVSELKILSHASDLRYGCDYAAGSWGPNPTTSCGSSVFGMKIRPVMSGCSTNSASFGRSGSETRSRCRNSCKAALRPSR